MFGKKEYQTIRKGKVLGFTASTGRQRLEAVLNAKGGMTKY